MGAPGLNPLQAPRARAFGTSVGAHRAKRAIVSSSSRAMSWTRQPPAVLLRAPLKDHQHAGLHQDPLAVAAGWSIPPSVIVQLPVAFRPRNQSRTHLSDSLVPQTDWRLDQPARPRSQRSLGSFLRALRLSLQLVRDRIQCDCPAMSSVQRSSAHPSQKDPCRHSAASMVHSPRTPTIEAIAPSVVDRVPGG